MKACITTNYRLSAFVPSKLTNTPNAADTPMRKLNIPAKKELIEQAEQLIDKWRPYLKLSDWRIGVEIISSKEIKKLGGCGCALATHSHHEKAIQIHLGDELGKCIWEHDLESCILHELGHAVCEDMGLHQHSIQRHPSYTHLVENICNTMAYALMKLENTLTNNK